MTSGAILITRPLPQAQALADLLARHHIAAMIEPMLEIAPIAFDPAELRDAVRHGQALLLTSAQAAAPLSGLPALAHRMPVWVVGNATAHQVSALGFRHVMHEATAQKLLARMAKTLSPATGPIIYLRGRHVAQDAASALCAFTLREFIVYDAHAAENLSPRLQQALRSGELRAVTFFSARTAKFFCQLVQQHDLQASCRSLSALCFSEAIAREAKILPWQSVEVCARPSQQAMAQCILRIAK